MTSANFINPELQLAQEFVRQTGSNIFLTGKAGTGKTTFLKNLQDDSLKRMIVTAPTGVAAINAGGVTLHSFFQLPFGPYLPGSEAYERNQQRRFKFSTEKKQIIKTLDLLVIDEISMVRADLLDAVDAVLRSKRGNDLPFGGVQLLMIGDLHQLSPVAKREDWDLLSEHYESVYFFSSKSLAQTEFITVELQHIYRQSDDRFINLLNKLRDNKLDETSIAELNKRYIKDLTPKQVEGYIYLTTHNKKAEAINHKKLRELRTKKHTFQAEISGEFPEYIYPAPAELCLKQGAQVMFVRNDQSPAKLYYNGKIGEVTKINNEYIEVSCPEDLGPITVEPVVWENIKYTLNQENKDIEEEIIGTFKQYPLKPAWAITIHKSQGLTFEKAIIDAQDAFAHGQIYVALSRCKTLEGMLLSSPIYTDRTKKDKVILDFDKQVREDPPTKDKLQKCKIHFQQQLLLKCFDFTVLQNRLNYFVRLILGNSKVLQVFGVEDMRGVEQKAQQDIFVVSAKFKRQLCKIFENGNIPEKDAHVLERISKASKWFEDKLSNILEKPLQNLHLETDNTELRKKMNKILNNLQKEIAVKLAGVKSCAEDFAPSKYLRAVSVAEIDFSPDKAQKKQTPDYSETDIEHPELFQNLKDWRQQKAREQKIALYQVLHQRILIQIAVNLPDSNNKLKDIKGVGKKTIEKYGQEIVDLVAAYRQKHALHKVVLPEPAKLKNTNKSSKDRSASSDTKQLSLNMFNRQLNIAEIAQERGLAQSTIEGHLSFFVEHGTLDINKLLEDKSRQAIEQALAKSQNNSLKEVKTELDNKFSYGQIKMVIAYQNYLTSRAEND